MSPAPPAEPKPVVPMNVDAPVVPITPPVEPKLVEPPVAAPAATVEQKPVAKPKRKVVKPAPVLEEFYVPAPTPVLTVLPEGVPESAVKRWQNPNAPAISEEPLAVTPPLNPDPRIPLVVPAPSQLDAQTPSEPKPQLSPETKKILESLPVHLAPQREMDSSSISIEHEKKSKAAQEPKAVREQKSHEEMGIKIEMNVPKVNVDYELEKAYDALNAGRSEAAAQFYNKVLEIDPNNVQALFGLATTYHRAGQLELARPLYARLLSIDPNHRDGLNNFLVLLSEEAPEEALKQLETLQKANPNYSPIPAQMAIVCQKLGLLDRANQSMVRAIELAPENLTYRYNFAIMLDKQHKTEEAAQLYQQIVQAYRRGETTPGNIQKIQQRLTFISSNRVSETPPPKSD